MDSGQSLAVASNFLMKVAHDSINNEIMLIYTVESIVEHVLTLKSPIACTCYRH